MSTRTIGVLGGMSWESTAQYYRGLNEGVRARLGGLHSARIALVSVDFHEIEELQSRGDWQAAGELLAFHARQLQLAGADFLLLATNTMHKVAEAIEKESTIPLLHIADVTASRLRQSGHTRIGLLGTRFTMEQDFYVKRLLSHGIEVLVPEEAERSIVHRVIYDELCQGIVREESRTRYVQIVGHLKQRGATAIVAACTEIGLLLRPQDCPCPLFDTTEIHVEAAVERALSR